MTETKVLFAGCARECASALPNVLRNLESMATLFSEAAFVFVENDSTDDTKDILQTWCEKRPRARLMSLDGFAQFCPVRTIRLEKARKLCLSVLRSDYADYTHLVVFDCDEVNAAAIDLDAVGCAVEFLNSDPRNAGVFAGQDGLYYDLWALRHPKLCPGDVWEEVYEFALAHRTSDAEAYRQTFAKRLFRVPKDSQPFEVDSAFGGLGIYKVSSVLRNRQNYLGYKKKPVLVKGAWWEVGWQSCEHVAFHAGFRENGERLFVLPFLVNLGPDYFNPNPSAYSKLIFDLRLARPDDETGSEVARSCPCGSGKPYRQCHGLIADTQIPDRLRAVLAL